MIQKAELFYMIADEATDVANDEQLANCVRFVDGDSPCKKSHAVSIWYDWHGFS